MIYFIQNTVTRYIKTGYSKCPKKRLAGLQTASPDLLVLLGTIHGGLEDERWLHDKFAQYRVAEEWFRDEILGEVQRIIAQNPIDKPPPSNVFVIGDRDFRCKGEVLAALDELHAKNPIAWVVTADERDLERWAWEWARQRDVRVYPYFPNWKKYGRGGATEAGKKMLRAQFDPKTFLTFLVGDGGTTTTRLIRQARKKGFEVVVKRTAAPVRTPLVARFASPATG